MPYSFVQLFIQQEEARHFMSRHRAVKTDAKVEEPVEAKGDTREDVLASAPFPWTLAWIMFLVVAFVFYMSTYKYDVLYEVQRGIGRYPIFPWQGKDAMPATHSTWWIFLHLTLCLALVVFSCAVVAFQPTVEYVNRMSIWHLARDILHVAFSYQFLTERYDQLGSFPREVAIIANMGPYYIMQFSIALSLVAYIHYSSKRAVLIGDRIYLGAFLSAVAFEAGYRLVWSLA